LLSFNYEPTNNPLKRQARSMGAVYCGAIRDAGLCDGVSFNAYSPDVCGHYNFRGRGITAIH